MTQTWSSTEGLMSLSTGWVQDETISSDVFAGVVAFKPASDAHLCQKINFVQTAQVKDLNEHNLQWTGANAVRNRMESLNGYFVDHDSSQCQSGQYCSPFFNDFWPDAKRSRTGMNESTSGPKTAAMADFPYGWTSFNSIRLESCAVCADDGYVYGCIKWGAHWPQTGDRVIETPVVTKAPSSDFAQAIEHFVTFYADSGRPWVAGLVLDGTSLLAGLSNP